MLDFLCSRNLFSKIMRAVEDLDDRCLLQRLKALDDGWEDVQRMWANKQTLLSQSLNLQVFLRDAKQAEVLLSQQDNFLSKEEVPVSNICLHMRPLLSS